MSQQIHCSNAAFSFPNKTSPKEFVIALSIPTVHHFTRNMHAHMSKQKFYYSFFPTRKRNCHRHVKLEKNFFLFRFTVLRFSRRSRPFSAIALRIPICFYSVDNYTCHFAGSPHFYFKKGGERKMGLRAEA